MGFNEEANNIAFKKIPSEEIIPFWNDEAHTSLDAVVRVYEIELYESKEKKIIKKIEFWDRNGVKFYVYGSNGLTPDVERGIESSHFFVENGTVKQPYNWDRPPFVAFKYNDEEQPLVDIIKSLIDNYNQQASINSDLLADIPKLIYILKNYSGEDLDEFLYLLNKYRAVKVADQGGVDKLQAEPNAQAVEGLLAQARRDIIEYGRGIDVQNENLGNASGVALKFRYSDLDMDCNIIETEFQAAFESLIWFVNCYFSMAGKGDYDNVEAEIIFNRDIIISESDAINDCRNSLGIISLETIISQHPWVGDASVELERLKKEENLDYQYPGLSNKNKLGDADE